MPTVVEALFEDLRAILLKPDQAAGIFPSAKVRWRPARTGGGPGGHSWLRYLQCHVFARPHFAMGGTASRRRALTEPRCASERGLAMGGGRPAGAASRWEAAANPWLGAIARCSRQQRVNKLSVPQYRRLLNKQRWLRAPATTSTEPVSATIGAPLEIPPRFAEDAVQCILAAALKGLRKPVPQQPLRRPATKRASLSGVPGGSEVIPAFAWPEDMGNLRLSQFARSRIPAPSPHMIPRSYRVGCSPIFRGRRPDQTLERATETQFGIVPNALGHLLNRRAAIAKEFCPLIDPASHEVTHRRLANELDKASRKRRSRHASLPRQCRQRPVALGMAIEERECRTNSGIAQCHRQARFVGVR